MTRVVILFFFLAQNIFDSYQHHPNRSSLLIFFRLIGSASLMLIIKMNHLRISTVVYIARYLL